jgi:hypothetical protein
MDVISRIGVIIAPAIGPYPGRPQFALAGSEDDAERFVVEYQGQTRHASTVVGCASLTVKAIAGPQYRLT